MSHALLLGFVRHLDSLLWRWCVPHAPCLLTDQTFAIHEILYNLCAHDHRTPRMLQLPGRFTSCLELSAPCTIRWESPLGACGSGEWVWTHMQ